MKDVHQAAFIALFREACEKCFGYPLQAPLSETDCKHLSIKIWEQTGLVIGVKSIRNYSRYICSDKEGKKENPSVATLDTLARYVLHAPYTDEIKRKNNEGHHPYWFQYKTKLPGGDNRTIPQQRSIPATWWIVILVLLVIPAGLWLLLLGGESRQMNFTEHFNTIQQDSLQSKGWTIQAADTTWWPRRGIKKGHLSLYTLPGDNWPTADSATGITNLLTREIPAGCFTTEIHLTDFVPRQNWQQTGILLAENDDFTGKVLRLSLSYNDFFGGYQKPPEIIIQAMSSSGSGIHSKPEEFAHVTLFTIEPGQENLVRSNLARAALKIEKRGRHYRFLYATGSMESFAFREAARGDFTINPTHIGLFAIKGSVKHNDPHPMPAQVDSFHFAGIPCEGE